jgi:DNA-binding PadR family transcriptional regulator
MYGYRIVEQFDGKLDPSTLHEEMSQLKANGHVTESPPDFRYTITDAGRALLAASESTSHDESDL